MEQYLLASTFIDRGMDIISVDKRRRTKVEAQGSSCLVLDDLQENCIYNILGRLPLESLFTSKLVCKSWHGIITSAYFRNKHLHRLGLYTRGIIFLTPVPNYYLPRPRGKVFSIESNSTITHPDSSSCYIKFMEFNEGGIREYNTAFRGRITATCDGLILLEENLCARRLILFNPVTREVEDIPVGTTSSVPDGDLYGLAAFSQASSRRYKLLHLFVKDEFSNLLGCEIMDIGSGGSWRAVDVPPVQRERFRLLGSPIFAMGGLHWIQYVDDGHGECLVSMPLNDDDEKFRTTKTPTTAKTGLMLPFTKVFEMGEFLGFSSRGEDKQIQVWIFRGGDKCGWEKQFVIDGRGLGILTPLLYCEGDDQLVLKCFGDKCFYAYDRHSGDLRKIETASKWADKIDFWTPFPHVNSLVSWRRRR